MTPLARRVVVAVVAVTVVGALVGVATAIPSKLGGGAIQKVVAVGDTDVHTTNSTSFLDLPGASATVKVPKRTRALLLVRFTAESACFGAVANCTVRILVGGNEALPASGVDFAFDTNSEGDTTSSVSGEAHAMDRFAGPLKSGTYEVKVQWRSTNASTTFQLDDWSLIVERAAA